MSKKFGWVNDKYGPREARVVKRCFVLCVALLLIIVASMMFYFYFWEIIHIAGINLHICGRAFREMEKWSSLCLLRDIALPVFWISIVLIVVVFIVITFQTTRKDVANIERKIDSNNRKYDELIERVAQRKFGVSSSLLSNEEFSDVLDKVDRIYPKTETPKLWYLWPL